MTAAQTDAAAKLLFELGITHFDHGAAVGAAEEASLIARDLGLKITGRPGSLAEDRSMLAYAARWVEEAAPLDRNKKLVDYSHQLIATRSGPESPRSGTWSTVNYARKRGKPVYVVMPNGRGRTSSSE